MIERIYSPETTCQFITHVFYHEMLSFLIKQNHKPSFHAISKHTTQNTFIFLRVIIFQMFLIHLTIYFQKSLCFLFIINYFLQEHLLNGEKICFIFSLLFLISNNITINKQLVISLI